MVLLFYSIYYLLKKIFSRGPKRSKISFQENKSGWCFIGEDSGGRSCSNVGLNDTCMSGEIFPSKDVCINPKLRM